MGLPIFRIYFFIGLKVLTSCAIVEIDIEYLRKFMLSVNWFKQINKSVKKSQRKDSKRSHLRKQLFYERQIAAMNRWNQVAVIAWK